MLLMLVAVYSFPLNPAFADDDDDEDCDDQQSGWCQEDDDGDDDDGDDDDDDDEANDDESPSGDDDEEPGDETPPDDPSVPPAPTNELPGPEPPADDEPRRDPPVAEEPPADTTEIDVALVEELGPLPVVEANQAPIGGTANLLTEPGLALVIGLTGLVNDPDGDQLAFALLAGPTIGSVELRGDEAVYTPADEPGSDQMVVLACDPVGACSSVEVNVTIRHINNLLVPSGAAITLMSSATHLTDTAQIVNEMLARSAQRLAVPLAGLATAIGGSLLLGLETVSHRLHILLTLLLGRA
jgi:hypothetical protein